MAEYRFFVADLLTGEVKDELPFGNVQYSRILNRPGAFSATIPTTHIKATAANLAPSQTAVYVQRDGVIVWGGILWTRKAQIGDAGVVTVGAEGIWSYWCGPSGASNRGRFLKANKTYTNVDQLFVARDLLSWSMARPGSLQMNLGTETSGALVTRQFYGYERRNIGQEIQSQAAEANGYDFSIESAWVGNVIENTFYLHYPTQGRRSELTFGLGVNIADLTEQVDGTTQANDVEYMGAGQGSSLMFGHAQDYSLVGSTYPVLEAEYQDTSNTQQWSLDAEAKSILVDNVRPFESLPTLTARVSANLQPGAFVTGDQVQVKAQYGCVDVDGWYRITSYTVTVDSEGGESVSIAFESAGVVS